MMNHNEKKGVYAARLLEMLFSLGFDAVDIPFEVIWKAKQGWDWRWWVSLHLTDKSTKILDSSSCAHCG